MGDAAKDRVRGGEERENAANHRLHSGEERGGAANDRLHGGEERGDGAKHSRDGVEHRPVGGVLRVSMAGSRRGAAAHPIVTNRRTLLRRILR
jgi:hypothetical protein